MRVTNHLLTGMILQVDVFAIISSMQKGIFVKIIFRTNGCLVVMNPMVEKAKNHPQGGYVTSKNPRGL